MNDYFHKFQEGDEQAFEELFRSFFPYVRKFVTNILGEDPGVNDIIQDAFVQVWHRRDIFENEAHFKGYIYKILRNDITKYVDRNRKKRPLNATQIDDDDIYASIIELEVQREVTEAIAALPTEQRRVILLSISGMTMEQIASKLGISINTVKTQKKRAYSTLRKELEDLASFFIPLL